MDEVIVAMDQTKGWIDLVSYL